MNQRNQDRARASSGNRSDEGRDSFERDYRGDDSMRDRDDGRRGMQGYGMSDYGPARGGSEYDMRDYNDGRSRNYGPSDFGGAQGRDFGSSEWRGNHGREYASSVGGSYGMRSKGGSSGYADVSDYGRGGGHGGMRSGIDYGAASNRDNQDFARGFTHDDRELGFGHRMEDWGHRTREGIKGFFGGPKNYKRSDERIREDVCDGLQYLGSRGHLDPSDIEVTVKDGEVILSGTVPQRDWKHHAEDLAEAVRGVREVDNRIRVQRGDTAQAPSSFGKSGRNATSTTTSNGNGNTVNAKG